MADAPDLAALRRQARIVARRHAPQRRVYLLPPRMVESIIKHQIEHALRSETAAAVNLLDHALTRWEATHA